MKRLMLVAVAALVLSFGTSDVSADTNPAATQSWQVQTASSSFTTTFTEGWFERDVVELGRKCFKRCKRNCKWNYKRCKRKFGKKYCKRKKKKCKKRCRRRCRY